MIGLLLENALALAMLFLAALGAGSALVRALRLVDVPTAVRVCAGLALLALIFGLLGIFGVLNAVAMGAVIVTAAAFALPALAKSRWHVALLPAAAVILVAMPVFVLALYPPVAFDETLYHLPTVRAFAAAEALPFISDLRTPVFPNVDEVLRLPLFVFGGDVATHLLAFLATCVTAAVVFAWSRETTSCAAGWIALSLFASAPIAVQLATTGYVEATLTMFVATAFFAFERWRKESSNGWLALSGFCAASAAGVKYLGLFWLAVLALGVLFMGERKNIARNVAIFAGASLAGAALWYGRILYYTGNPLFPFLSGIFGHSIWDGIDVTPPITAMQRVTEIARLPYDALVDRARVNYQPPLSPFLIATLPLIAIRAFCDRRVRILGALVLVWAMIWSFLPHDARYLESAIPLAAVAGAAAVTALIPERFLTSRAAGVVLLIVVLPAPAYALYRIQKNGAPPDSAAERVGWLKRQVAPYSAISVLNARAVENDVAYVCGGEELAAHFRGTMIGDFTGPARYDRIMTAPDDRELTRRLDALGVRFVLVVKSRCGVPALTAAPEYRKLYEDAVAVAYERARRIRSR